MLRVNNGIKNNGLPSTFTRERERFDKRWNLFLRETASINDFSIFRTIGLGSFSRIYYVKNKNKYEYALKLINKNKVVASQQIDGILTEKKVLQSVVHPFLINLRFVFKTNKYLCFVLPFIKGADLYSHLENVGNLSEDLTRFYAAQIILAVQYLHTVGIVYRDLKPENILLDSDGYIKLTSYKYAKKLNGAKATSFVGTPEYMAPEILVKSWRKDGYTYSVDWWALAVLIYEFVVGKPAFTGNNLEYLFSRIVKCQYPVHDYFTEELTDYFQNSFVYNVNKRIGNGKDGAEEIKRHQWFSGVDWDAILQKKVEPEFIPSCSELDPTENFGIFREIKLRDTSRNLYPSEFRDF